MAVNNWEIYFNALKKQDWASARDTLRKISVVEKDNPQVYLKMGDVSQRLGDTRNAIFSYHNSARLLRLQGFGHKAIALYKIILRLDPRNSEAIEGSAQLLDEIQAARSPSRTLCTPSEDLKKDAELPAGAADAKQPEVTRWTVPDMKDTREASLSTTEGEVPGFYEAQRPSGPDQSTPPTPGPAEDAMWDLSRTTDFLEEPSATAGRTPQDLPEQYEETPSTEGWFEHLSSDAAEGPPVVMELDGQGPAQISIPSRPEGIREMPEFFSGMSEEEFSMLLDGMEARSFSDGEKIIEEGDSGDSMYLIKSGSAKVVAHMLGRAIELAILDEGDLFGEVAFLTGRPRTASVVACGTVEIYEIKRVDIERMIEKNPGVLSKLEDFNERRVKDTIKKIKSG